MDFSKLDKTIHERARLSIMTLLATRVEWSFQDLKAELRMSDGNLITHLRTLEKTGYVSKEKDTSQRPQTIFALTKEGRSAFNEYLDLLRKIVELGEG